jgi:hypothetical protein
VYKTKSFFVEISFIEKVVYYLMRGVIFFYSVFLKNSNNTKGIGDNISWLLAVLVVDDVGLLMLP